MSFYVKTLMIFEIRSLNEVATYVILETFESLYFPPKLTLSCHTVKSKNKLRRNTISAFWKKHLTCLKLLARMTTDKNRWKTTFSMASIFACTLRGLWLIFRWKPNHSRILSNRYVPTKFFKFIPSIILLVTESDTFVLKIRLLMLKDTEN